MPVIKHNNILFFLFDSLSYAQFERLVHRGELPAIAKLQNSSVQFTRCYTPCPESSPARASLFTGLDPSAHGLWTNGVTLPEHEKTFPQLLKQAGYATYLAGRNQLAGVSRWTTEQARMGDFNQIEWAHGPLHRSRQNDYLKWLEKTAPEYYFKLFPSQANPDNTQMTTDQLAIIDSAPDELSFNHWVGTRVGDWINGTTADKPFLAIASFCVGSGFGAETLAHGEGEALNSTALQQADAAINRSIAQLQQTNRAQDTVIVIASARGNYEAADSAMKESSINVPLLIAQPDSAQAVIDAPISTIDIAPTVLRLANVGSGPRVQGCALSAVCNDATPPRNWAMARLQTTSSSGACNGQTSFCTAESKLIINHSEVTDDQNKLALYDLKTDPHEQNNLAHNAENAAELENMIDQMIDACCALEDRTEPRIAEF